MRTGPYLFAISFLLLSLAQPLLGSPPPGLSLGQARELLQRGQSQQAISILRSQARTQDDAELHHLLSRAYYSLCEWDAAVSEGERAIALDPDQSDYHLWLGRAYGEKAERASWFSAIGLAKKVRQHFERAVQLNGSNVDARSDLAEFYLEAPSFLGGGADKAKSQADALSRQNEAAAHWVKARVAEKAGDKIIAEAEYKAAIAAGGNRPDAWLNLAGFYLKQNRMAEMESAISKATDAQKQPGVALLNAARLLLRAGRNLPLAALDASRYIAAPVKNEEAPEFRAHYLLGQILEKQGDRSGAVHEYQVTLNQAGDFAEAREALARVKH